MREERCDQRLRKVGQRFIVVFRNQEAMTVKEGPMIEERYGDFALKDDGRIKLSSDDAAKGATLSHASRHSESLPGGGEPYPSRDHGRMSKVFGHTEEGRCGSEGLLFFADFDHRAAPNGISAACAALASSRSPMYACVTGTHSAFKAMTGLRDAVSDA